MSKNTGGPAFPDGVTLLDFFAAAALPVAWQNVMRNENGTLSEIAEHAYAMAEAMLIEREHDE